MRETKLLLSKGDWVCHPRMPGWGYGQVLELIGTDKGRVLFLLAGEKKLSWEHAGLVPVEKDNATQAALSGQLAEFKLNLAIDLLTSAEVGGGVTCTPCDSPNSICELCKCSSESVKRYMVQKNSMCICGVCRDKIIPDAGEIPSTNDSAPVTEKKIRKAATGKATKNNHKEGKK